MVGTNERYTLENSIISNISASYTLWLKIISIFGIITSFIIICSNVEKGYELMFLLPLLYVIFLNANKYLYNYTKGHLGFLVIHIVMFIRYVITPFSIIISGYYGGLGPQPSPYAMRYAFLIMIYEMIAIMFVIRIYGEKKYIKDAKQICSPNMLFHEDSFLGANIILILFSIVSSIYLSRYPNIIVPNNLLIIKEEIKEITIYGPFDDAWIVLANCMKLTVLILALKLLKHKYDKTNSIIYPLLGSFALIAYLALLTSTKRWGILIAAIIGMYILSQQYPKYSKFIVIWLSSITILSLFSISLYKFFGIRWGYSINYYESTAELLKQIQAYFSGPRNVGLAIEMSNLFKNNISLNTLINDFIGSIPYISNFINQYDRINAYYNYYIYGVLGITSQIIPMCGVGYAYFSFLGAPLFTVICIYLAIMFDSLAVKEKRLEFKYIYNYASIWCALCMGFNTQIIFGWFMSTFFPVYFLFLFNKKINLRKAR